jgi:release factor glutamine methyltransferase
MAKCNAKKTFFKNHVFSIFEGVYEPAEDTFLIAENLEVHVDEEVLDVGSGCGILSVLSAQKAKRVVAVDINPDAARCTKFNTKVNEVSDKVEVLRGDLFGSVKKGVLFDAVLFNAPYLPTEDEKPQGWIDYAWSGGKEGRELIDRFVAHVNEYLKNEGRILLVQSTLSDVKQTLEKLRKQGFKANIVAEQKTEFETIVLIQAEKNRGKIDPVLKP